MDEVYIELKFDKELPCVACGRPAACGVAYRSEQQGITGREFENTWILNPYCERATCCRDKAWIKAREQNRRACDLYTVGQHEGHP